jgi:hypothetical protein
VNLCSDLSIFIRRRNEAHKEPLDGAALLANVGAAHCVRFELSNAAAASTAWFLIALVFSFRETTYRSLGGEECFSVTASLTRQQSAAGRSLARDGSDPQPGARDPAELHEAYY